VILSDMARYVFGILVLALLVFIARSLSRLVRASRIANEQAATAGKRLDAICNGLFELRENLRVLSDSARSTQAAKETAEKLGEDLAAVAKKAGLPYSK
jgi:hypothetical protein